MDKKPKIFANKIEKELKNNDTFYYSDLEEKNNEQITVIENPNLNNQSVSDKINSIFSSPKYVYKMGVNIKLKDKEIKTKIIGHNLTHLITFDNELIPIADIVDIDFDN